MVDKPAGKTPDTHVGSRIRMRRVMLGMSQEKLGDALGITFQQVQKYEKGKNRVGAGRLFQIAQILQVPVSFFFDGLSAQGQQPSFTASDLTTAFFTIHGASDLARHYVAIERADHRRVLVDVAGVLAESAVGARQAAE